MANGPTMFNEAQNNVFNGSTFIANSKSSSPVLQPLLDKVSLNAILNAGGRADDVGCYPGTRDMVIRKLERWMDGQSEPDHRMFWLSGPAGAGKSAIMQTVAERCNERETHAANFFFFREDGTRNNSQPLVATLVYQLIDFYPALRGHLEERLTAKPLVYKASTAEQFIQFISSPFKTIQQSSSADPPIILIIDGLDECNNKKEQVRILESLHALVEGDNSPFRVLVASRAEHQLQMFFNNRRASVESIFLDDTYRPEEDIRRFVIAKFDEIKQSHPLCQRLSKDWPAEADIHAIIRKSSGQFIYAATIMRFIQHSSGSPALSLRTIQGVQPPIGDHPLAHLNAVYSYVFSRANNIQAVKAILCIHFIVKKIKSLRYSVSFGYLLQLLGYKVDEIESYFADLVAVVQVTTAPQLALDFYHASLPDYLQHKTQSGIYHVDIGKIAIEQSLLCLKKFHDYYSIHHTVFVLAFVRKANSALSDSLLGASTRRFEVEGHQTLVSFFLLLRTIERLYFDTDRVMFKRLLQDWVYFAHIHRINLPKGPRLDNTTAKLYYKWYITMAKAKSAVKLVK